MGADVPAGGMPAGRAARPPPPDPRWGFLSWLRLFFRAIGFPEPSGVYRERGKALDTSNRLWYKLPRVQDIACARSREPTRARSCSRPAIAAAMPLLIWSLLFFRPLPGSARASRRLTDVSSWPGPAPLQTRSAQGGPAPG